LSRPKREILAREEADLLRRYAKRVGSRGQYSIFDAAYTLEVQQRERVLLRELQRAGIRDFATLKVLDIGCGSGGELLRFGTRGVEASNLYGIDLLPDRVAAARRRNPLWHVSVANAATLPWSDCSFDLVSQFTTFSSILSKDVRVSCASEISRVLRPGGYLLWYDFWLNPTNKGTHGIGPTEVRRLFPDFVGRLRRVTLAPPIARRVAPLSWSLAIILGQLAVLQSHYLGVLRKPAADPSREPT
jgi:SAM-dependent methyltransferase